MVINSTSIKCLRHLARYGSISCCMYFIPDLTGYDMLGSSYFGSWHYGSWRSGKLLFWELIVWELIFWGLVFWKESQKWYYKVSKFKIFLGGEGHAPQIPLAGTLHTHIFQHIQGNIAGPDENCFLHAWVHCHEQCVTLQHSTLLLNLSTNSNGYIVILSSQR